MEKVYITRCIVKKNGKSYKKGSVIKDLTGEEIRQGLAERWLEAVGNDDDDGGGKKQTERKPNRPPRGSGRKPGKPVPDDPLEKMTAGELIAEAVNLGLQADNSMSEEALRDMIREAQK
jgi:hypothetical protein